MATRIADDAKSIADRMKEIAEEQVKQQPPPAVEPEKTQKPVYDDFGGF